MDKPSVIGIDLGATHVRAAVVKGDAVSGLITENTFVADGSAGVVAQLSKIIDQLIDKDTAAIGIGVPGLVYEDRGLVVDALNIPSWQELPLKHLLSERYQLPVLVNNDANCFALAEYRHGKARDSRCFVALSLGTGLGSGIIINGRLFPGSFCAAGEFGMIDYRGHPLEYYASGQFFQNVFAIDGAEVFRRAEAGDANALAMFGQFGEHLGNAINIILYSLAPDRVALGGSVAKSWRFFHKEMQAQLALFAFKKVLEKLTIEVSELQHAGILGAAGLYDDSLVNS